MKLHHVTLAFAVIAVGLLVSAQIQLVVRMQKENIRKTEYDCLVSAVNATVDAAFDSAENTVTEAGLALAEEVFFQTLSVLHEGEPNRASWERWRQRIPCLVLFEERGYYVYQTKNQEFRWTELIPYENGKIPDNFFEETETSLMQYHTVQYGTTKRYHVKQGKRGIWEQSLTSPCVFAIYAPQVHLYSEGPEGFLYAAAGRAEDVYLVTEDNYCHYPSCTQCKESKVIARYDTQKESALDGAMPCEKCMR